MVSTLELNLNILLLLGLAVYLIACEPVEKSSHDIQDEQDGITFISMDDSVIGLGVAKQANSEKLSNFTCRISTKLDDNAEHNYWNNSFWVKYHSTTGQFYNCVDLFDKCAIWTYQHEDQGSQGSGSGSPGPGPCDTNPDPTLLCMEDGMGGAYDVTECNSSNPPIYCSNPCPASLEDGIFANKNIQYKMQLLWEASGYGTFNRMENGAFIGFNETTQEPFWTPIPDHMISHRDGCRIILKISPETRLTIQNQNIKYFIHTHPWTTNERQSECGFPELTYKSWIVQDYDKILSDSLGIPGIFMDANNMVFYNETGKLFNVLPCGYKQVNKEVSL